MYYCTHRHTDCVKIPTIYTLFLLMLHILLPVSTFVSLKAGFNVSVAYKILVLVFFPACLLDTRSQQLLGIVLSFVRSKK